MKKANKVRIVERDLSEHIRQENAAYREIIRKRIEDERLRKIEIFDWTEIQIALLEKPRD